MSEDLQSLLEKINREGVEKARTEADKIIADAKAKAADIVKTANAEAAKAKADAEKAAADYASRAAETVRQAERDTILKIESSVTALLEKVLKTDVDTALADEKTAAGLVAEAIKDLVGSVEVAAAPKLAAALKAQLASKGNVTVVMDDTLGTGFSVKTDGGRDCGRACKAPQARPREAAQVMSTDYIVASLPTLAFDAPAPITWEKFAETAPDAERLVASSEWNDLETQLRNAMAAARGGAKYERFQEKEVAKRQDMIDRVWWDAAGELTPPASPLGSGALATYAVRLKIALRRSAVSTERGNAAFDRLTAETKESKV